MRLYDRIMDRGLLRSPDTCLDITDKQMDEIGSDIQGSIVIYAQNVLDFLNQHETRRWAIHDLPPAPPSFPAMWIEWDHLPLRKIGLNISNVGVLVRSFDLWYEVSDPDERLNNSRLFWQEFVKTHAERRYLDPVSPLTEPTTWNIRWAVRTTVFLGGDNPIHSLIGPIFSSDYLLDDGGSYVWDKSGMLAKIALTSSGLADLADVMGVVIESVGLTLAFTMGFMNCRNVSLDEQLPSRHKRREAQRRNKPHPTTYYTLVIEPMRHVLRAEGGLEQHGLKKAVHICRGHFAHYSDDKPLFGKYTGSFWRPAHVRGSLDSGEIKKDYWVNAPNAGKAA